MGGEEIEMGQSDDYRTAGSGRVSSRVLEELSGGYGLAS